MVPIKQDFIPEGAENRPGRIIDVWYVVIHNTGDPGATDEGEADYAQTADCAHRYASWHYSVDSDSITQSLPVGPGRTEQAYHAADGEFGPGNLHGVAIEICEIPGQQDKCNDLAAQLTAYLLKMFNLPLSAVKQHHDFYNKNCPRLLRATATGWSQFLLRVWHYMEATTDDKEFESYYFDWWVSGGVTGNPQAGIYQAIKDRLKKGEFYTPPYTDECELPTDTNYVVQYGPTWVAKFNKTTKETRIEKY